MTDVWGLFDMLEPARTAAKAAGLRVVDDVRDAVPPCIVLLPPTLTFRFGKGYIDAEHSALALSTNTERRVQYAELSTLIDRFQTALGGAVVQARPASQVWTVDHQAVTAAYELIWTDQHSMKG